SVQCQWLEQWRRKAADRGITILITKFEQMALNARQFFGEILDFFGAPPSLYERLPQSLERMGTGARAGNFNFRRGTTDEWRSVLSPAQVRRIEQQCADTFDGIYEF